MSEMMDFTDHDRPTERLRFRIDDDVFECPPVLPAAGMYSVLTAAREENRGLRAALIGSILDATMLPESAALFAKRMADAANPITDKQVAAVFRWFIEAYGLRPTTPASSSSDGLQAGSPS